MIMFNHVNTAFTDLFSKKFYYNYIELLFITTRFKLL
jgi:hypothetical protein